MSMTIDRIAGTFEMLQDWEERYQFIYDLGKRLPALDERFKDSDHQVHGCMSQVWFNVQPSAAEPDRLELAGESDTAVIQGIVAILVALYSGKTLAEMLAVDADEVFERLGIYDHLSPNRHVGVYAMVEKIRSLAQASAAAAA